MLWMPAILHSYKNIFGLCPGMVLSYLNPSFKFPVSLLIMYFLLLRVSLPHLIFSVLRGTYVFFQGLLTLQCKVKLDLFFIMFVLNVGFLCFLKVKYLNISFFIYCVPVY